MAPDAPSVGDVKARLRNTLALKVGSTGGLYRDALAVIEALEETAIARNFVRIYDALHATEAREARLREALTRTREQIRMLFKQTPDEALRPIDETLRAALSTTAPETGGDT